MDNKLSELSKPVAYKFDHGVMGPGDFKYGTPQMHSTAKDENASPLYSQEYVSALLAELEAKEEQRATWANRAEILGDKLDKAEKSITALDVRNAELHSRIERWATDRAESANQIEELEAKLAKPVRLPELCGDGENDNEYTEGLNDGINQSAKAIRAAGFTVEGDA